MDNTPLKTCQLCGQHPANQMTTDSAGNACWSCGYCRRWHPRSIEAFLHAKRLFGAWRQRLASELEKGMNDEIE